MSKRDTPQTQTSSTQPSPAGDLPIITPASTPSDTSGRGTITTYRDMDSGVSTGEKPSEHSTAGSDAQTDKAEELRAAIALTELGNEETKPKSSKKKSKCCHKKHKAAKKVGAKKASKEQSSSNDSDSSTNSEDESDSSSDDETSRREAKKSQKASKDKRRRKDTSDDDESEDDTESSEEEPKRKKKKAKKVKSTKQSAKDKRKQKSRKQSSSEESDSEDEVEPSESARRRKKKTTKKAKKAAEAEEVDSDDSDEGSDDDGVANLQSQINALKLQMAQKESKAAPSTPKRQRSGEKSTKAKRKGSKKHESLKFQRVDQLWDSTIHNFKLKESAEDDETEFAEYAFLVRRCFNWENKYTETVIDIKSKQLRAVLTEVMKDCKSVSLEAEEPTIDPNVLFLYLEELRRHGKKTLKAQIKNEKKRKVIAKLELQRSLCKTLVAYLDEDYADTKKTLYPLLEAGNITFDLLWALFKPNDIAITSSYGAWDEPRCFKVDYANKYATMQRGEWYCVEGRYLEYDGKSFGYGDFEVDVEGFKGPRKITSLSTYPLKYHKDADGIRKKIIERGQTFVNMEGMQYKFHKGLAFMKKKKQVAKIHINGRIMIDPATFRRINPNYPISFIKPKDSEDLFSDSEEDSDCCCGGDSDDEDAVGQQETIKNRDHSDDKPRFKYKWATDDKGRHTFVAVEVDENGDPIRPQRVDQLSANADFQPRSYTEEELLVTSPVVLGFAFSEKLWLEFSLSGVHEITYNEDAFESLVLPPSQKEIIRALVESHKFDAAKTIDDVVVGKGKGLVAVLHGPPGTGKTLTAESISELLKCPLYMVSAGELGTDPARLEHELQKILDVAHSWGAVLLLDEADVFLEAREVHDIHRNALVSIFLRQLEYFQGILFLTTNRVNTFDEAFQSRIHLPLRYGELTTKAKKSVWKMFLDLVRKQDASSVAEFADHDLDVLSRHQLNGRQIKNAVRTAQALALREHKVLSMEHVKKVLDVSETFDRDLKGGTGYVDAMRSYT